MFSCVHEDLLAKSCPSLSSSSLAVPFLGLTQSFILQWWTRRRPHCQWSRFGKIKEVILNICTEQSTEREAGKRRAALSAATLAHVASELMWEVAPVGWRHYKQQLGVSIVPGQLQRYVPLKLPPERRTLRVFSAKLPAPTEDTGTHSCALTA